MRKKEAFNPKELTRIAEIINNAIAGSEFSSFGVSEAEIDRMDLFGHLGLLQFADPETNPITKIYKELAVQRYGDFGQFYHFKSVPIALDIIRSQSIQVSNLLSNQANDYAEYEEYFRRYGPLHKLIPKDRQSISKDDGDGNEYSVVNANGRPIDEERENIFILCFTKDSRNVRFWKEYVNDDTGLCFAFRFLSFNKDMFRFYDFRDVAYDVDGYRLDFINYINYHLGKEFDRQLLTWGLSRFAKFYKRGKYAWENESRLAFDFPYIQNSFKTDPNKLLPVHTDPKTGRRFVNLTLLNEWDNTKEVTKTNPFFLLTIDEVIVGKNVSDSDYLLLEQELRTHFPHAIIRKKTEVRSYLNMLQSK